MQRIRKVARRWTVELIPAGLSFLSFFFVPYPQIRLFLYESCQKPPRRQNVALTNRCQLYETDRDGRRGQIQHRKSRIPLANRLRLGEQRIPLRHPHRCRMVPRLLDEPPKVLKLLGSASGPKVEFLLWV